MPNLTHVEQPRQRTQEAKAVVRLYNAAHFLPHRAGVLPIYTYPSLLNQDLIYHIVLSALFLLALYQDTVLEMGILDGGEEWT
jgi:hypothetical protein